jgi:hypothetical protein
MTYLDILKYTVGRSRNTTKCAILSEFGVCIMKDNLCLSGIDRCYGIDLRILTNDL